MSDRSFENTLKDFTDEVYLNENNSLKKEYCDFIWDYLNNHALLKLDSAFDLKRLNFDDPSVYTGISGISLVYLKLFEVTNDGKYLDKANSLNEISLESLNRERVTFLCGDAGPLAIAAYIAHLYGKQQKCQKFIERLISRSDKVLRHDEKMCDELLYGRAGYIYALLFVRRKISNQLVPESLLLDIFNVIIHSGKKLGATFNSDSPLMFEWHGKKYIGAAHGLSGIFYMLLTLSSELEALSSELASSILPSINFLISCKYPSGNYQSSLESDTDKLVQFCHGSAGVEFVFNLAYKLTQNQKYLDEALKCGEITWKRGLLRKGYGICHGTAGNGYTLLDLFNLTNDPKWLHRTMMFAKWCCTPNERQTGKPDHPLSLYEGLSGTIYFLLDLLKPKNAKFPGLQL